MARLFDMADRRHVGSLNVTDLQVVFADNHGEKPRSHDVHDDLMMSKAFELFA